MMASNNPSPFWNQDAVLAAGLTFAGMAVLQGKLLPAIALSQLPFFKHLSESMYAWWPVLLIVAGVVWLIQKSRSKRVKPYLKSGLQAGGDR
jgi:hypothetical protein